MCLQFTFIKFGFWKASKFFPLLKVSLPFFFKCKYFFLPLAYFCSESVILIHFLVKFVGRSFLIDLFNKDLKLFRILFILRKKERPSFFCHMPRFKNQWLVFCNYIILGWHILNISKTVFWKLIFHLQLSDQLPDVLLYIQCI